MELCKKTSPGSLPFANIQQLVRFLLLGNNVREYILNHLHDIRREELYGYYTGEKSLAPPGRAAASVPEQGSGPLRPARAATPGTPPVDDRSDAGSDSGGSDYLEFVEHLDVTQSKLYGNAMKLLQERLKTSERDLLEAETELTNLRTNNSTRGSVDPNTAAGDDLVQKLTDQR